MVTTGLPLRMEVVLLSIVYLDILERLLVLVQTILGELSTIVIAVYFIFLI